MDGKIELSRDKLFDLIYVSSDTSDAEIEACRRQAVHQWFNDAMDQIVAPIPPVKCMAYDPLGLSAERFQVQYRQVLAALGIGVM